MKNFVLLLVFLLSISILSILGCASKESKLKEYYANPKDWIRVYNSDAMAIEVNKNNIKNIDGYKRYTFFWKWSEPRELKKDPGKFYKYRIEQVDINVKEKKYRTFDIILFDENQAQIPFGKFVPSETWDPIEPGSVIDEVFNQLIKIDQGNQ